MKRSLLLILICSCLPLSGLQARQEPSVPRPANPAPPARRNSAYDDAVAKARALAAQKEFKAATTASEQAIQMDDKRWEGYIVAAEAYAGQQLYDDAIGMLQAALMRAPADKKAAVRDAIGETRKLLSPPPKTTLPSAPARAPNPASIDNDNGPNLEVTIKFIQDKLNEQGPVRFIHTSRGGYGDKENLATVYEAIYEVSELNLDPKTCLFSYHTKESMFGKIMAGEPDNGNSKAEHDIRINLKDVGKILVVREQQVDQQISTESSVAFDLKPPQISIVPQVTDLFLTKAGDWHNSASAGGKIMFEDDDLANRVAKALTRAVELCTPDRKTEPF
jgi:tetratricopeptide (TPR) repeat protein